MKRIPVMGQRPRVAGVGQLVQIQYPVTGLPDQPVNQVGTDEARAAGYLTLLQIASNSRISSFFVFSPLSILA